MSLAKVLPKIDYDKIYNTIQSNVGGLTKKRDDLQSKIYTLEKEKDKINKKIDALDKKGITGLFMFLYTIMKKDNEDKYAMPECIEGFPYYGKDDKKSYVYIGITDYVNDGLTLPEIIDDIIEYITINDMIVPEELIACKELAPRFEIGIAKKVQARMFRDSVSCIYNSDDTFAMPYDDMTGEDYGIDRDWFNECPDDGTWYCGEYDSFSVIWCKLKK